MDPDRRLRLGRVDHRRIPIRASCSGNLVFKRFHMVSEALSGTGAPIQEQAKEIAEAALAHTVRGVEGAYFRYDLFERRFERRRGVMEAWAEYISETVRS